METHNRRNNTKSMVGEPSRLVILWGDKTILGTSIEYYLSTIKNWKVIQIGNSSELEAVMSVIDPSTQCIVILHHNDYDENSHIALQLMRDYQQIKVIMASLNNNVLQIYDHHNFIIQQASDLIYVIDAEAQNYLRTENI